MARRRVLIIGLDGFDVDLAERYVSDGALPNFARLRAEGACYELDHGRAKLSGLAWEQFSTGKSPRDGGRWSSVMFDSKRYAVRQEPSMRRPFLADLAARTVVFDLPYCNLPLAPNLRGVSNWGAHDPGTPAVARPSELHEEFLSLFGPYPAAKWIYGFCWPSPDKARAAGDALRRAVLLRSRAARWLLSERLPDWDLGVVVVAEGHSAIETLWHGVDPDHPLHGVESAAAAASALRGVYEATDQLIGELREAFPDTTIVAFAMHGMGPNDGDIGTMVLLPELLYRSAYGSPYMKAVASSGSLPDGTPLLEENASWEEMMLQAVPRQKAPPTFGARLSAWLSGLPGFHFADSHTLSVEWMPAARYAPFWPGMPAFALPAYYDGRIRINVAGRESKGIIPAAEYSKACKQTIELLEQCTELRTGERAVGEIHWPEQNPHRVGPSDADLYVDWRAPLLGLSHPRLGSIGPVPYRRTGGHTGAHGFLCITGQDIVPGNRGVTSSFDIVPTIVDLLGEKPAIRLSGKSLAGSLSA